MKYGTVKDREHTYKFYFNRYFYEGFKYGDGTKFWGYVGTRTEPLCVEVCNFEQCCIFINFLT
jgi:hypothetical protein